MKKNVIYLSNFFLFLLTFFLHPVKAQESAPALTTFILIRHAEKMADGSQDPPLSEAGRERAAAIANLLSNVRVDAIFSSDYKRTRSTARPLAEQQELEVQLYDPRQQEEFLGKLLKEYKGKTLVVVGHSNTVPFAVNVLLRENRLKVLDESEYEQVFIVSLAEDGSRKLLPLRLKL